MSELDDPVKIYDQVVTRIQNEYKRCYGDGRYFKPVVISPYECSVLMFNFVKETDKSFWEHLKNCYPEFELKIDY